MVDNEASRKRLEQLGIAFTEDTFLSHVRNGNTEVVSLFLEAGMSADTKDRNGAPALILAYRQGQIQIAHRLVESVAKLEQLFEELDRAKPTKDRWDKLSALSPFATILSTLLIALVGWYFTQSYNRRQSDIAANQNQQQNRLLELETIEKMIPHLTANEESKRVALIAIHDLGNPRLAIEMAQLYPSAASIDVLQQLANLDDTDGRSQAIAALSFIAASDSSSNTLAETALQNAFRSQAQSIVALGVDSSNNRVWGTFVGSNGLILTQYDPSRVLNVMHVALANEALVDADLKSKNESSRLAMLKVRGPGYPPLRLAKHAPVAGSLVIALGYQGQIRVGIVEGVTDKGLNIRFPNAGTFRGTVGVPVVNASGEIVGIVKFYKDESIVMAGVRSDVFATYVEQAASSISAESVAVQ